MKISVTNEHFFQNWFLVMDGKEREMLLRLMDDIDNIYPHEVGGVIYPAIKDKDISMLHAYAIWCDKPRIRFSIRGVDLGPGEKRNGNSYYNGEYPMDPFFNAEVYLPELDETIVRWFDSNLDEVITYAQYKWCKDMGLDFLYSEKAKEIELKYDNARKEIEEFEKGGWTTEEDEYSKFVRKLKTMPYKEYLKTKHWKHFRDEAIKFYQSKCQLCSKQESSRHNLHLHHNNYENRGRETFNDVILLCSKCHQTHHGK